jgi:hypothetical protein
MGKQVTEDDLKAGLKSVGSFGPIGSPHAGSRRDSPFGNEFVKRTPPAPQPVPEPEGKVEARLIPAVQPEPFEEAVKPSESKLISVSRNVKEVREPKSKRVESSVEDEETSSDEHLPERVTLRMSAEMRDSVTDLARRLQRRRREKGARITANTVVRVGIQFLLDEFHMTDSDRPSNEEELALLVRKKFGK